MHRVIKFLLFFISLLSFSSFAENNEIDKSKILLCIACHGENGKSILPSYPNLAGLSKSYIYKQLQDIKTQKRQVLEMQAIVQSIPDSDLQEIAAYYSKKAPIFGATDPQMLEFGKNLFLAGKPNVQMPSCTGCHGTDGRGFSTAPIPGISGQNSDYVIKQLTAFREQERMNDGDSAIMREIAGKLTDREIKALASYIAGLRP